MPKNIVEKVLEEHLVEGSWSPASRSPTASTRSCSRTPGSWRGWSSNSSRRTRVQVPQVVQYVDHNTIQLDHKNPDDHFFSRHARCTTARPSAVPNGISPTCTLRASTSPGRRWSAPTHTTTAGAAGMFSLGIGGMDAAVVMAGFLRADLPERGSRRAGERAAGVGLGQGRDPGDAPPADGQGRPQQGVRLRRSRRGHAVGDAAGHDLQHDPGAGGTAGIFPADERTREWLRSQNRESDFRDLLPDDGARYEDEMVIDLAQLEPLIAKPRNPDNVVPVRDVAGTKVAQVCVGPP